MCDREVRSHLSIRRYGVLAGAGLVLTGLQLLLMPRWLTARNFGLVVLSISATQAVAGMGDFGLARLCIDSGRPPAERARLRRQGQSAMVLSATALLVSAAALAAVYGPRQRAVLAVITLGGLAGAVIGADKFRATRQEVAGDEVGASALNFVWTNGPKVGLLVGLVVFRGAVWITLAALGVTALLSAPTWPGFRPAITALREARTWASPFLAILSSFVLVWSDTYFLSAHLGVGPAGAYEALYRILGLCTYLFLPWVSVLTSRVSLDVPRPVLRPLVMSVSFAALGLAASTLFVYSLAPRFFPHLRLPFEAMPGLVALYLLMPVSYALGTALYARSQTGAVTRANVAAAVVALTGHAVFTLRGGPAQAADVAATAMAVAVATQATAYLRTVRPQRQVAK